VRGQGPLVVALVLVLLALGGQSAAAASLHGITERQLNVLNPASLDRYLNGLGQPHGLPPLSLRHVVNDLLHRKNPIPLTLLITALTRALGNDLAREGRVLGILLILTVLGALLNRLTEAFPQHAVADVGRMVVLAALVGVAVSSFLVAVSTVNGMVTQLVSLMEATIPVVVVLMASSGAVTSAGIFHPLLMLVVNTVALATKDWVLPLILLAVALELISGWMPHFPLTQLAALLKQVGVFSLGALLTLFLGVIAMVNVAGKMSDSLALRTGKFLTNAMIPVVGKMFSDAMDVVLRSSGLLLSALGLTAGLAVIVIVAFPLLKVLVMLLFYRLGAAASEPLAMGGVTKTLTTMAGGIGILAALAAAVALMFFMVVTVVVAAAGGVAP
jgi:stage III sporulation protein AE